jgi:hypothetical protein
MVAMTVRVRDLLAQRAGETFVGRADELSELLSILYDGPRVVFVHGIAGIGKSTLLEAFADRMRARGAAVVTLDCRAVEPTERGLLYELGNAIGGMIAKPEDAVERLASLGSRVVLSLDNYEVFRLMDTWLRNVFVPLLPDNVRVVLVGRDRPVLAWLTSPGWLLRVIALGPLRESESAEILMSSGIGQVDTELINRFACGHPLALKLATTAVTEQQYSEGSTTSGFQWVVEELTRLYLADVSDPLARQAIDASSVIRRTTLSLLRAMLPNTAPQDAFERLQALPFVENDRDGLCMHGLVQQAIAASLRAIDPSRYQEYRRAAWRQLNTEARNIGLSDLWRYTADLLFIIENPVVREGFFPTGTQEYVVEPAREEDGPAIKKICNRHEPPSSASLLRTWWKRTPQSFHVVRKHDGAVAGFYLMFDPATISPSHLRDDPIVQSWWEHIGNDPVPKQQRVLFLRRWLSREHGEAPSSVQAACWLDIKRSYLEMRPHLRRVYLAVQDLPVYAPVAQRLGFRPLVEAEENLGGVLYHTALLDFGPASVDGWLAGLVANELGVAQEGILDVDARELVLDGERVKLTKLEFDVFSYLYRHEGKAVTRAALIEQVWGYKYAGSNVVDATVRSLRKKLGINASTIETIRGSGYRFHKP